MHAEAEQPYHSARTLYSICRGVREGAKWLLPSLNCLASAEAWHSFTNLVATRHPKLFAYTQWLLREVSASSRDGEDKYVAARFVNTQILSAQLQTSPIRAKFTSRVPLIHTLTCQSSTTFYKIPPRTRQSSSSIQIDVV